MSDDKPLALHLSLNVTDLDRSVAFYGRVFGMAPTKQRPDYAKFEVEQPPLVLSLEPVAEFGRGTLNHIGLRLPNGGALVELQRRLELAGLSSQREEGVECCYAKQTKFWLHDPDGTLWEFYVLEGDLDHRGAGQTEERIRANGEHTTDVESDEPAEWEHRLGDPLPERLPVEDASLDEVRLRGTFNMAAAREAGPALLAEVRRVLVPGGRVVLHQLTAERAFADGMPALPGPAAVVEYTPVDAEFFDAIEAAGFTSLELLKFGDSPCFVVDGIAMRETLVSATTPTGPEDAADSHETCNVVYKGPLKEVVDDLGRIFRRGRRTAVPDTVYESLRHGAMSGNFTFLPRPTVHELT